MTRDEILLAIENKNSLRWADLCEANLREADLRRADLREVDLREADLRRANLREADLRGADLRRADLRGAGLREADLRGADLPAPSIMLLASWGRLSDQLTADLMEYDAANHPDRSAFDRWARGGPCPYNGITLQRAANFIEQKKLWGMGELDTPYNLMRRVFAESKIKY